MDHQNKNQAKNQDTFWENKTSIEEKQTKGFHKNSRRIENEVFIMYIPDHELVTASNLQKNPNCFKLSLFGMEYLQNPHEQDQTLFHGIYMGFLFLILNHVFERAQLIHDLCFFFHFIFVCFDKYIDQFRFFLFLLILFQLRCMDPQVYVSIQILFMY